MSRGQIGTVDGRVFRIVEKPTHTVIYKTYGKGPFYENVAWNSRHDTLKLGSVFARALVAAQMQAGA